jgi:hypothetical protein
MRVQLPAVANLGVSPQMKYATKSDFNEYAEGKILHHSRWFYVFRVGGFFLGVVIPIFGMIWGVATGDIKHAVIFMFCMVPFGLIGFVLSFRSPSFCMLCGRRLEQYWSNEVRADGRYSGLIVACNHCKTYEARITYDFEG